MNPRPDDVDGLARAIDRVVFAETGGPGVAEPQSASVALISYLNDSFPRVAVAAGRRERLQRRMIRALRIPSSPVSISQFQNGEVVTKNNNTVVPRWTPVVGGAALVLLGVVGFAVWRQRGSVKPAIASLR